MVTILHTNIFECRAVTSTPTAEILVLGAEADMAWAGVIGIAARVSAAIRARLKRTWESLIVFMVNDLLGIVETIVDRQDNPLMMWL